MDELKPVSNKSHNWLGLGATLVDCLDNLWIMGMKDEFYEARDWVAQHLHFDRASGISRDLRSHTPHSPHLQVNADRTIIRFVDDGDNY